MPKKILYFIESLRSGGKERRFIELLHYLSRNSQFQLMVILTCDEIHYSYFIDLKIPYKVIERKKGLKKDPSLFVRFYTECKKFNPDIVHTWGTMTTFYSIPAKIFLKFPLVANLIADSKKNFGTFALSNLFFKTCCYFSDFILGNSEAGFNAYGVRGTKKRLIYNGVRFERFSISIDKEEYRKKLDVHTEYMVVMVASASVNKDYDFFLDIAKHFIHLRNDVTFIGVGGGSELDRLKERVLTEEIRNVILAGNRSNVETLIASADIGVLFTNTKHHAEGISNSIIEYMALGLPVITTDTAGGSREIIMHGKSGFILNADLLIVSDKIIELLNNQDIRDSFGNKGKEIIHNSFSIERMGNEYQNLYFQIFSDK